MDMLVNSYAQWGLAGLEALALVGLLWVVLRKVIPGMLDTFRQEMQAERKAHDRHMTLLVERLDRVEQAIATLTSALATARIPWYQERPRPSLEDK
jgi:hypothetical protein